MTCKCGAYSVRERKARRNGNIAVGNCDRINAVSISRQVCAVCLDVACGVARLCLDGHNSTAQQFGTINYYDNGDITKWCDGFALQESYGLRTFWDLQQNQEIQKNEDWQEKMIDIEMKVSQKPDFQKIAFFHHLIFEKRGN